MGETVTVPKPLLRELYKHFARIEEVLATLEELMDKEGLERVKKGLEEYKKREYTTSETIEDVKKALTKDYRALQISNAYTLRPTAECEEKYL